MKRKTLFLLLLRNREDKNAYIDCIRDIALVFEKQGMMEIALEMMLKVHNMKPHDKLIEAKVNELKKLNK